MEELMEKLAKIAEKAEPVAKTNNDSSCSGCCWGGSCCSNPVSG